MNTPPFTLPLLSNSDAAFEQTIKRYQNTLQLGHPPIVPPLHPADSFFNPTYHSLPTPPTCPLCSFTPTSPTSLSAHFSTAHPSAYGNPLPPLQQAPSTLSLQVPPPHPNPLPALSTLVLSQAPWHPLNSTPLHPPQTETAAQSRGDFLFCDICNIHCETVAQKSAHMEGQKHRKRQQIASQFSRVAQRFPQEGIRELSTEAWACILCRLCLEGRMQVIQHLESTKHKKLRDDVEKGAAPKRAREGGTEGGEDTLEDFVGALMKEKGDKEKETGLANFSCAVCGVNCNSMDNLNAHLASAKHKKRQLMMEGRNEELGKVGATMHCTTCNITCSGVENFEAHMNGRQHAKKTKLCSVVREGGEGSRARGQNKV